MRQIISRASEARVRWKNRVSKTRVLIAEMDKFLPHETRVPKKMTNEEGDEDEKPRMERRSRIREPKMRRRSRSTRSENLSGEHRSKKKNQGLENADSMKKTHGLIRRSHIPGNYHY